MPAATSPIMTPDGRYPVLWGSLWRRADPALADEAREGLVNELMAARRDVRAIGKRRRGARDEMRVDGAMSRCVSAVTLGGRIPHRER